CSRARSARRSSAAPVPRPRGSAGPRGSPHAPARPTPTTSCSRAKHSLRTIAPAGRPRERPTPMGARRQRRRADALSKAAARRPPEKTGGFAERTHHYGSTAPQAPRARGQCAGAGRHPLPIGGQMITVDLRALVGKLNDHSRRALEAAAGLCLSKTHYEVEIEHFLLKLSEQADG